jgi:hypothetical protein
VDRRRRTPSCVQDSSASQRRPLQSDRGPRGHDLWSTLVLVTDAKDIAADSNRQASCVQPRPSIRHPLATAASVGLLAATVLAGCGDAETRPSSSPAASSPDEEAQELSDRIACSPVEQYGLGTAPTPQMLVVMNQSTGEQVYIRFADWDHRYRAWEWQIVMACEGLEVGMLYKPVDTRAP